MAVALPDISAMGTVPANPGGRSVIAKVASVHRVEPSVERGVLTSHTSGLQHIEDDKTALAPLPPTLATVQPNFLMKVGRTDDKRVPSHSLPFLCSECRGAMHFQTQHLLP
jgi:hypothetical protein